MKEKIKYGIYGVLYMLMWMCSLAWCDTAAQLFFGEPSLEYFALLATHTFVIWVGVSGMTRNINKIQMLRALEWTSEKEGENQDAGKRED